MLLSNTSGMPVCPAGDVRINSQSAICITGHRINSVKPYLGKPENMGITIYALRAMLGKYIDTVMNSGFTTLISGLAQGTDLWAAEHVLRRKRYIDHCVLIGAMPFLKHADRSRGEQLELLYKVERYCDLLVTVNPDPAITYGRNLTATTDPHLYRDRNRFLVDNSSAVVAFFNEEQTTSGTAQTVNYAVKNGLPIYSFSLADVYALIDRVGMDRSAIMHEAMKISFAVQKPLNNIIS